MVGRACLLAPSVSSGNQITPMAGKTENNSLRSPGAFAYGVECRQGFERYVDGTLSWINEGHTALNSRSGVAAQSGAALCYRGKGGVG
jgi:hypothetical protein